MFGGVSQMFVSRVETFVSRGENCRGQVLCLPKASVRMLTHDWY